MNTTPIDVTLYSLIPSAFIILGSLLALFYSIGPRLKSFIQHLVAGIVFAAVSVELLPKILNTGSTITVAIGFSLGTLLMLSMMWLTRYLEDKEIKSSQQLPLGLMFSVLTDIFLDGFLIGVSFIAGRESGMLISVSLATCAFFLALSISMILKDRKIPFKQQLSWVMAMAALMPIGAFIGSHIVDELPPTWLTEILAFGVAALLYLATEELVIEAHEDNVDTPWITAPFFIGFLAILLLKM